MSRKSVTVVGAGFSGLASAFYLSRAGFDVEVYESSDRAGGLIGTLDTSFGLVETGPNALLNSARVEELFGLLGLTQVRVQPSARRRYIFRSGRPRRWPLGFGASIHLAGFLVRYLLLRKSVAPRTGETLRAWGVRTVGLEASQFLIEAGLQGVYAGDPESLSAKVVLEAIFHSRSRPRRGKFSGSVTAEKGMGELISVWRQRLENFGVRFHFQQTFPAPARLPQSPVVLAVPVFVAAELLQTLDPIRAQALQSIETLPLVTVTAAFAEAPKTGRGFGCLFPWRQGRRVLGVLMNGLIFPGRVKKGVSETWLTGGADPELQRWLNCTDQEILNLIAEEREMTFHTGSEILGARITRWPRALPHYTCTLEKALPELTGLRQNVVLVGNYLGGIGLAKILERAAQLPEQLERAGEWRD